MRAPRPASFERAFRAGDDRLFQELMQGILGAECTQCRETYADGIVLDIGNLVSVPAIRGGRPAKPRGEWVVASWGCDIQITDPLGGTSAASDEDFSAVMGLAQRLVGTRVAKIVIQPPELSLLVDFSNKLRLTFRTDADTDDLDQWYIQLPSALSLTANARGSWSLTEDSRPTREGD